MIEVRDLSLRRGAQAVLKQISFSIAPGEFVSIVGPNGAGKTSLLKCMIRVLRAGGQVRIDGKNLMRYTQRELARKVAFVAQGEAPQVSFKVDDFVLMARYPYRGFFGGYAPEDMSAVRAALEKAGAAGLSARTLAELSAGERQRVYLAGAIAQGSSILLLDEPATFLDPSAEDEVYSVLARLRRETKLTVLMVTHDLNRAVLSSTRILGMKQGQIAYDGPSDGLMDPAVLQDLFAASFEFVLHPAGGVKMVVPSAHP